MADETIVITGDASSALGAVQALQRRLQSLQGDLAEIRAADVKATAAGKAEAAAWKARADNINAWKRAASGVAPQLTGIIDSMEEFAEGSERVGAAAMAARVGVLAMGTAWTVAATATVAAGAAMVASSVEVITHLQDYSQVATRHREALVDAAGATAGLHERVTELRVEIAGQMAPTIGQAADAMAGLAVVTTEAAQSFYDVQTAVGISWRGIADWTPVISDVLRLYDQLAREGRRAREEAAAGAVGAAAGAAILARLSPKFSMEEEAAAQGAAQEVADSYILASRAATQRATSSRALTAATHAQTTADDGAAEAVRGLTSAWTKATGALGDYLQEVDAANRAQAIMRQNITNAPQVSNVQAGRASQSPDMPSDPNAAAALATNAQDAAWNAAKSTSAAWRSAAADVLSSTGSMIGSVGNFIAESYAKQAEGANKYSQAHRNALRKQFAAQKAAALAQAAIGLALGIMQVWSTWSALPPVAAALTAVVGAIGAVQIGLIAAQKPSFHRGGVYQMSPGQAPDERSASLSMLQTERLAVIPQRGALGSESEVARQSTGEDRGQGAAPAPVVYIMDGSGRRTTRLFAGLSPLMGRRRIA